MSTKGLRRIGIALGAVVVGLALAEAGLRVGGFRYDMRPELIDYGGRSPDYYRTSFDGDPDVFWVPHGYDENLARLRNAHPRIVFMGDSCTQLARYDDAFARSVEGADGGKPLAFGNVGVVGWSSWQGRRQLERDVLPLKPRVVTLYYGWNDHWIGYGIEDKNIARIADASSPLLDSLRLGQLVKKLRIAREIGTSDRPNRVSEDDFRANLAAMIRGARAAGVVAVLITAPSAHVDGGPLPGPMTRYLRRPEDLVTLHSRYAEIVREVARDERAPLCDLELQMHGLGPDEPEPKRFMTDGIHLTPAGADFVGDLVYRDFVRQGLVKALVE